jgi:CIC family chloride channel protein
MKRRTNTPRTPPVDSSDERGSLTTLALLSLLAGAASGLVGACFRRALEQADHLRNELITWAYSYSLLGLVLVVALAAAATALAAWLVRRFAPDATGSGIPHVEAVLKGEKSAAPILLLPVKFVGGLLAIGAGLALGREGPTVQMGASVSHLVGRIFRRNAADARILLAAGAGAGLATAFNAPIAGSIFVLEELMRRFDTRITIATLGASAAAIGVSRLILGEVPDFALDPLPYPAFGSTPVYLVLGLFIGLLGLAYNRAILASLAVAGRLSSVPVELRAAVVGAAVGLLAWHAPTLVGGGDPITARALHGNVVLTLLPAVFALRFALGAVSYAAGTPGGLFAPLLVLGAQAGLFYGTFACQWFPAAGTNPTAYAVTGMAAFFTAVVRAPVTGIILVIELTSSDTQLLSMLAACFTAMLIPTLAGNRPIYDSLGTLPAPEKK